MRNRYLVSMKKHKITQKKGKRKNTVRQKKEQDSKRVTELETVGVGKSKSTNKKARDSK